MAKAQKIQFKILNLQVKEKASDWMLKIKTLFDSIPEAKRSYKANIKVNDNYFDAKIDVLNMKIDERERNPDMFGDGKKSIASLQKDIAKVQSEREAAEELEIDEFDADVALADFDKNILLFKIPDSIIEDIIKIRQNVEAYIVELK